MPKIQYMRNVSTLWLEGERCIGCGMCREVCPHAVFAVAGGKARIVDRDSCMECGACAVNCPVQAIGVDSGVGCASAIIVGALKGTEPTCDCGGGACCC